MIGSLLWAAFKKNIEISCFIFLLSSYGSMVLHISIWMTVVRNIKHSSKCGGTLYG